MKCNEHSEYRQCNREICNLTERNQMKHLETTLITLTLLVTLFAASVLATSINQMHGNKLVLQAIQNK